LPELQLKEPRANWPEEEINQLIFLKE